MDGSRAGIFLCRCFSCVDVVCKRHLRTRLCVRNPHSSLNVVKAAYVQFNPRYLEPEANRRHVASLVDGLDADLIVLPELFSSGYFFQSTADAFESAETIPDGPTTAVLQSWASDTGATLVAGLAERDGDALYNSAVVVDPDGYVGTYRKVHLYYQENDHFTPGDLGFPVFDCTTRDGETYRLGVMVCFDWYFPEATRTLALNGADVIAHPSNLVLPHCPDAMPVRARENHVYTITANRYGSESNNGEDLTFIGMSEICDPSGEILIRAGRDEDAIGVAKIAPEGSRDRAINAYNDVIGDRRPETYAS